MTNFIWHIVPLAFCVWWGIFHWRLREQESLLRRAVIPVLSGSTTSRSQFVRTADYIAGFLAETRGAKVTIHLPLEPSHEQMRALALLMADKSPLPDPNKSYVLQLKEASWEYSK